MNGNGMVGLDGSMNADTSAGKVKRTRLVEPSEGGMKVISRSKGFRSAYERRRQSKKVSMLLVCVAALIIVSAFAVAAFGKEAQTRAGIQAAPVASFTAVVTGPTVNVDGSASTSDTSIVSYDWNWGDNVTGKPGVTSSHTYLITRTYTITLTVTDTLGQKGTSSNAYAVVNSAIPPLPFYVLGTTYASDGVTPLPGCTINITDVRTGTTLIGTVSDGTGFYAGDISLLYQLVGDNVIVNATGPAGETGFGTGVIGTDPYVVIDVTLTSGVIPEFTDIVIPIVGMISIFAVARVASSRRGEEKP